MSRILAIAFKDLRSTARNIPALAMMLAAPLALSALLGFAFGGGGGSGFSIAATKVAVVNQDRWVASTTVGPSTNAGQAIVGIMRSKALGDILTTTVKPTVAAAKKSVDDGKSDVAVIIPAELSKVLYGTSPTARSAVELYENPTQTVGGATASGKKSVSPRFASDSSARIWSRSRAAFSYSSACEARRISSSAPALSPSPTDWRPGSASARAC